jgi:hypothetical protein
MPAPFFFFFSVVICVPSRMTIDHSVLPHGTARLVYISARL